MKIQRLFLVLAIGLLLVPAVFAKEGGDQYPYGAENWFAGATPPPGFYYINYFGYYSGELKDGSGNKALLPDGTTPEVNATFDAFRFLEMTKFKIFGADYGMHVIVPVVDQSVDMMVMGGRASMLSVGDIVVDPLVLGWHHPQWHAVAAFDIDLPTGHFNKTDPRISVGANYYSFEPIIAFTYLPKSKWEASTKLMYNLKTINQATNYHSGQEFHADYVVGKHVGGWMLGASGYALEQTTDDTLNGQTVAAVTNMYDTGRRGQVVAVGPSLAYESKSHMNFILQWQHETLVQNRFGGDKFWFKMIFPTGLGTGKK
jgi:hypothetical protein